MSEGQRRTDTTDKQTRDVTPGPCVEHGDPAWTVAVSSTVSGELGFTGQEVAVTPGVYGIGDIDAGECLGLITESAGSDDVVWVKAQDLGLLDCLDCSGRGQYTYRVYEDEWDADQCESCEGWGMVKPDVAEAQQVEIDSAREAWHP